LAWCDDGVPVPFPLGYTKFVELFNSGLYWESHEALEGLWRANKSPFYRGLIIYASAFVHAKKGNPRGVRNQLEKARRYLEPYRPKHMGLDVDRVLSRLEECLACVSNDPAPEGERLVALFPFGKSRLCLSPHLVKGDEPELEPAP